MQTSTNERGLVQLRDQRLNPLLIPEIAQYVYRLSSKKDGYRLAQVCSFLFNSLIPLVWEDVIGIEELLQLVVGAKILVDTGNNIIINVAYKSLTDEDLTRFKLYAPFVKELCLFNPQKYTSYRLNGHEHLLAELRNSPLLPSLRTLFFDLSLSTTVFERQLWRRLLFSPSLRELTFINTFSGPPNSAYSSSSVSLFFEPVPITSFVSVGTSVSSVRSSPPSNGTTVIETESKNMEDVNRVMTVRDLSSLSKLRISVKTFRAEQLSKIGLLPSLEHLKLEIGAGYRGQPISPNAVPVIADGAFPRLRRFDLMNLPDAESFHEFWSIKPLVSRLTSASLHFDKYRWMSGLSHDQMMSDFIGPICERSTNIVDLSIGPPEYESGEEENCAPIFYLLSRLPLVALLFEPLVPLRLPIPRYVGTYHLLRKLEVATCWLEVGDIQSLAIAFPNLEYLAVQIGLYPEDFQQIKSIPISSQRIILWVVAVFMEEYPFWNRTAAGNDLARLVPTITSNFVSEGGWDPEDKFTPYWSTHR
ncbi:hypothetical protein RHS01_00003 [Rhizoctonia solani]|uniref:Uncharacterized protein n=1 Tax=Rhizoctonia solani TaxID=456999 RepID=A0A8H7IK16_9AGAM|nr:hypothetical protein RHS01_00003 [Rhizoctonia solani]